MLDLKRKIRDEYIMFEQMMLATSRQNIYNKAEEISMKSRIYSECTRLDFSEADTVRLYTVDNLLEYIYGICVERNTLNVKAALEEIKYRIDIRTKKHQESTDKQQP